MLNQAKVSTNAHDEQQAQLYSTPVILKYGYEIQIPWNDPSASNGVTKWALDELQAV